MKPIVKSYLVSSLIAFGLVKNGVSAHDLVPALPSNNPILIKNATLNTVTQGVQHNSDLLILDGKIQAIGSSITPPSNAKIIDATGKQVYPGFIALNTTLGLNEIEAVRATRDSAEVGSITPEVSTFIAFNADSEIIPTVRSNGISHAEIVPQGGGLAGQSSLMHLDGWNWQDALVKKNNAMYLRWPNTGVNKAFWETRSTEKQNEDNQKALDTLIQTFKTVRTYAKSRSENSGQMLDLRWEAMLPVLRGDIPLYIHADDYRQIEQAIQFSIKEKLKIILVGLDDGDKAFDLIQQHQIPVVLNNAWGIPNNEDQPFDHLYQMAKKFDQRNIPYALAISGYWNVRDLPFAAGQTIANGVSPQTALRSITLEPAKILGLDHEMGSLEVGKQANIVISRGDVFDHLTQHIEYLFIQGREVNLNNRHKQLYEKYSNKK